MFVSSILATLYLSAILFKRAGRLHGESAHLLRVIALFIAPLTLAAYWTHDGDLIRALGRSEQTFAEADWWVFEIVRDGTVAERINMLRGGLLLGLLDIAATLGLLIADRLSTTRRQPLHKAVIKWAIVVLGGLVVLQIDVSTILIGTSVAVVGIGFVLKETLENLFTGITLELEGTLRVGDWIEVGDTGQVGEVILKTWRAVKIRTLDDIAVTIPNRMLGGETVRNYDRPRGPHARNLYVGTSYNDPPIQVKDILRTILLREPEVLAEPAPLVRTIEYSDFSINFEMKFWVRSYAVRNVVEDRIMTRIWYAFRYDGIEIPFPIRTVHFKQQEERQSERDALAGQNDDRREKLAALPVFARLKPRDLAFLAQNSFRRFYTAGERVIIAGQVGDAIYFCVAGGCEALLPDGRRPSLGPGHYFGEMGLLKTGPRTVDVVAGDQGAEVLRIDRHCMELLFEQHPELRDEILDTSGTRRSELPDAVLPAPAVSRPLGQRIATDLADLLRPW